LATGIVPAANASDCGGSLRIPAACCGLVGLKVSRGRISTAPHAEGRSIKVEGHIARTMRDTAALLDVSIAAPPGAVGHLAPPEAGTFAAVVAMTQGRRPHLGRTMQRVAGGLRIGLMTSAPEAMNPDRPVAAAQVAAARLTATLLEGLGHRVDEVSPPGLAEPMRTPNLYAAERAVLRATLEQVIGRPLTAADVEPRTWTMFELAGSADGISVLRELENEQRWAQAVRQWWDGDWDLLLTPALGRDVPLIGELKETADDPLGASIRGYPMAWFSYPFNVTGQPAIVVPVDWSGDVPAAAQLVAAVGSEDLLLAVAAQLEQVLDWPSRWPDGAAGA
jgi:amidase